METVFADVMKIEIKVRSYWTRATPEWRQGLWQCGYKPRSDQDGHPQLETRTRKGRRGLLESQREPSPADTSVLDF